MRWLIVNDNPIYVYQDTYFRTYQWPEFALGLIQRVGAGTLLSPVVPLSNAPDSSYSPLSPGSAKISPAPWHGGFIQAAVRAPWRSRTWHRKLLRLVDSHDLVLQRVPSPYLEFVASVCRLQGRPLVLVVAGDLIKQANLLHRLPAPLVPLAGLYLQRQLRRHLQLGRTARLVFAHGAELASQWRESGRVLEWRTGHLMPDSLFCRQDTCQGATVRLIRVCHLSAPRGVESLIDAFAIVAAQLPHVVLDVVGDGARSYVNALKERAEKTLLGQRIRWHGQCQREVVQTLMRKADIQVVSSLSDAVPRVILEGAASGLPLVATSTGGIPSVICDSRNGLLVPSARPQAMANSILRLIRDGQLRRSLIKTGYEDAGHWTLDATAKRMIGLVQSELAVAANSADSLNLSAA